MVFKLLNMLVTHIFSSLFLFVLGPTPGRAHGLLHLSLLWVNPGSAPEITGCLRLNPGLFHVKHACLDH